jgi:hypothetical protein
MGYVLIELVSGQADFLGPSVSLESSHKLDRAMRADLADVKRRLPDRLGQLIPAPARNCQELMDLCLALIHPDPAKRFASAEKAIDVTAKFKDALATAKLAMPWVKVGKYWLTDAKKAMSGTDSRG